MGGCSFRYGTLAIWWPAASDFGRVWSAGDRRFLTSSCPLRVAGDRTRSRQDSFRRRRLQTFAAVAGDASASPVEGLRESPLNADWRSEARIAVILASKGLMFHVEQPAYPDAISGGSPHRLHSPGTCPAAPASANTTALSSPRAMAEPRNRYASSVLARTEQPAWRAAGWDGCATSRVPSSGDDASVSTGYRPPPPSGHCFT